MADEQVLMKKIEFAQVKKQVEVLATFLPDEILKKGHDELEVKQYFVGVLLFADVSGFTQLTEKYNKTGKGGIYRLTATLNAYIGAIVEVICFYGGDVLKFSGDAFLALWKVMPDESLFEILHVVVVCALVIQQTLGHFETEVNVELKVKLAISCGNMAFSVIGDRQNRHYLLAGDAINDVKAAEHVSVPGDVVISPGAWAHMLQERYEVTFAEHDNVKVWSILYKPNEATKKLYYHEKQLQAQQLTQGHINHRNALHAKKRFDSNLSDSKITERFIRTIPQRVQMKTAPKRWIVEDLRPFIIKPVQELVDESQPVEYLTEMRDITIQFINIVPASYHEKDLIELVNVAYIIVTGIAGDALGVVNKVSLFDKDAMILVLFGLRAINHEMESQNALRSAYKIKTEITKLKDVKSVSIGITHGFVYCGVVGHPMRREYTVIGGAVNKAARIMCSYVDKVTCDHKTFRRSKLSSYYFQLQAAVKLKGIADAGNIFEYNENFDVSSQLDASILPVVGYALEYGYIKALIEGKPEVKYNGLCFYGAEQSGKTKILQLALTNVRKTRAAIVASIALEGSAQIPYFCITKLYKQIYDQMTLIDDDEVLVLNLPRELWSPHEALVNNSEDVALQKYRTLNYFRDLARTCAIKPVLIVDNIEHIDQQSWEIVDLVLLDGYVVLIASSGLSEGGKFDGHASLKRVDIRPLADKYVPVVACQLLSVFGMPKTLVKLLVNSCDGRPGYIQSCLLRLLNNGSLELEFTTKADNMRDYVYPPEELLGKISGLIRPVVRFSEKYKQNFDNLTLATISLDLFDSFTPYQQLVIKTGAVLGDLFTRTLLIVALKYPSELTLAKVIEQLFREEIFECGARYIYAMKLDASYQNCCRCYFNHMEVDTTLPKYAFCKILRFKNKSIRDVAYDLLPNNQRTELHLLCTELMENINNKCPNCLRYPINNYINFGKFKSLMMYCNSPKKTYSAQETRAEVSAAQECVRRCFRESHQRAENADGDEESATVVSSESTDESVPPEAQSGRFSYEELDVEDDDAVAGKNEQERMNRLAYARDSSSKANEQEKTPQVVDFEKTLAYFQRGSDPKACNCFDILARVYRDLIYHSQRAVHIGKRVFFTLKYGLLLILMKDYMNAIATLTEARELCYNESVSQSKSLSGIFRKVMIGKIETALAKSYLEMRQLRAARNHLAIALRQFNIPSVSLAYKHFSKLLTRSFLVNRRRVKPLIYKNTVIRSDLAACMHTCTTLFIMEGNWKMTQLTSAYSLYLISTLNTKIELLCEAYCTAIDIARYTENADVCLKLQRFAVRDLQANYAYNLTYNLYSLTTLLMNILEVFFSRGNLPRAIRIGYRVLDIGMKIPDIISLTRIITILVTMLMLHGRIKETGDLCLVLRNLETAQNYGINGLAFHNINLRLYRRAGFYLCPLEESLAFASVYFRSKIRYNWIEYNFILAIYIHHLLNANYDAAEEWKHSLSFNRYNIKRRIVYNALIYTIEAKILLYIRSRRLESLNLQIEEKVIANLMQLAESQIDQFHTFSATYYCIKAWMLMLKRKKRHAFKLLKRVEEISVRQENVLYYATVLQLRNAWGGGYHYQYHSRPALHYKVSVGYTAVQLAQYITPYPLY